MVNLKDTEFCNPKTAAFIKVNSKMERSMDPVSLPSGKMEIL
jgi:hypothetical protein